MSSSKHPVGCARWRAVFLIWPLIMGGGCGGAASTSGTSGPKKSVDIRKARLPWRALAVKGGSEVAPEAFFAALSRARAVCIGETHDNPHHHWAQLSIVDQLTRRNQGNPLALGMEMFQRPFQGVLDDFAAGKISEEQMLSRTGYKARWGYDWGFYRPIVRLALERGARLLALNTARELTKKVSREGIESLTPEEKKRLPELVLDDARHRAWWKAVMGAMSEGHGHGHGRGHDETKRARARAMRIYTAQVLWDETMADTAARWLAGGADRRAIILAGNGHCHESAIVRRIERRGVADAVSVHPVIDDGEGNVAELLARPENDFLFVMSAR